MTKTLAPDKQEIETRLRHLVDEWVSYGSWRRDFESYRQRMYHAEDHQGGNVKLAQHAFPSLQGVKILDLGCGQGGLSVALARLGSDVTPCDLNLQCCEMASLRGLRHGLYLSPTGASAHELPFPDESFDLVACCDVLEHVGDPLKALREVRRVLRPDGACVVNFHHRYPTRDPHFRMNFINWLPMPVAEWMVARKGRDPRHQKGATTNCGQRLSEMHYFTCRAFRRLCREAGLDCEILMPGALDDKPMPFKRRLRPFQNQYKAVLRVPKSNGKAKN